MTTLLILTLMAGMAQAAYQPAWKSIDSRPNPQWFEDAKFGVFIVWGVYSVPAWGPKDRYAEWYWHDMQNKESETWKFHEKAYGGDMKYQDFAHRFKAELFDSEFWADVVVRSGAKYVVFTTKFHDGFSMWPDEYNWNWNAMDIGPHRNLVGEVTDAMRSRNIRVGFYYSLYEWFNPLYNSDVDRYVDSYMLPQMKSLVERYKPDLFWPDGEWEHPSSTWRSAEFLAWLFNESSAPKDVAVNDRWGKEARSVHGGFATPEYQHRNPGVLMDSGRFEECQGMGKSFGLNRNESAENYRNTKELLHLLIDTVSRGGNLLLDVGPSSDGCIPEIMEERLLEMGEWLAVNGDAIYGADRWEEAPEVDNVRFTQKGDDIYAICLAWPDATLTIPNTSGAKEATATLLGHDIPLNTSVTDETITINIPCIPFDQLPCRYTWVFKLQRK